MSRIFDNENLKKSIERQLCEEIPGDLISYEESKYIDPPTKEEIQRKEEIQSKKEFEQEKKLCVLNHADPVQKPKAGEQRLISKILRDINKLGLERAQ